MPASVTIRSRVDSTDLLRGTVMILMALDHTQDFFSAAGMNPRDVTGPALQAGIYAGRVLKGEKAAWSGIR